ncbi:MAG: diguanylate cyclase [Hydrogenophaga sp.]|nr:diguanylate cyclase [Hydrogenophaga sp.]
MNVASELPSEFDFSRVVCDLMTVGMVVVDRRFSIVIWSRFMELNSGVRAEHLVGKNLFDAFPELNRNWLEKKIKSSLVLKTTSFSSWQQRPYLFRFKPANAEMGEADFMHQNASIYPVYDSSGAVQGACIAIQDVSDLAEAKVMLDNTMEQALSLEESSHRDALTGVYNRRFFDEQITREILNARRYNWPMVVAMIDVDHFKRINDSFGHPGGDEVLRRLGALLGGMLRSSDTLSRYGGEEFALILSHIDRMAAPGLLERLRVAVERMVIDLPDGRQTQITISMGAAQLQDGQAPGQLVSRADEALYAAKHGGRNRIEFSLEPVAVKV